MIIGLLLDDTLDRSDGVQQSVLAIGKELSKRKHEVHYVVAETERTDIDNVHSMGSSISLKFNGNSVRTPMPISTRKIVALFSEVKFDVLHVQMPFSPVFSARILNNAPKGIKKYGTFHILPYNNFSKYGTGLLGRALKKTLKDFNNVFAVSKPANDFMYSSFGVKGTVLPNPVDYSFFHSFKKQKKTKTQIVFIGRFAKCI
jgi:phosphatidylinositol alpha-mannosyltransferase